MASSELANMVNVIRVLIVLVALAVLFVTPLWSESPSGRQLLTDGLVVDLVAVAAILGTAVWWWRSRARG